jgi:hypothetical protein
MKSAALLFVGRVQCFKTQSYHQNIIWALRSQGYLDIDAFLSHNGTNISDPLDQFLAEYNITKYESVILPKNEYEDLRVPSEIGVYNYNSVIMWYHWKRAYEIAMEYANEHHKSYDIVFYIRADADFQESLQLPPNLEENHVYIPKLSTQDYICDHFSYGSSNAMGILLNLYSYMRTYYSRDGISIHPEKMLQHHINTQCLIVKDVYIKYQLDPNRRKNTWFVHPNAIQKKM